MNVMKLKLISFLFYILFEIMLRLFIHLYPGCEKLSYEYL